MNRQESGIDGKRGVWNFGKGTGGGEKDGALDLR